MTEARSDHLRALAKLLAALDHAAPDADSQLEALFKVLPEVLLAGVPASQLAAVDAALREALDAAEAKRGTE